MQYAIVINQSVSALEREVNERLSRGWSVSGSLLTYSVDKATVFAQPMIYDPNQKA